METWGVERWISNEEPNAAQMELDQWDEGGFRILKASLSRHYPTQAAFLLDGLGPSQGFAAVAGVSTLLDRLDALESSPEREATRAEDHGALELLAKRGIDKAERLRLRGLVQKVTQASAVVPSPTGSAEEKERDYIASLIALRSWFEEWSEVARVVIRRRDWLILLGLARRKRAKGTPDPS